MANTLRRRPGPTFLLGTFFRGQDARIGSLHPRFQLIPAGAGLVLQRDDVGFNLRFYIELRGSKRTLLRVYDLGETLA